MSFGGSDEGTIHYHRRSDHSGKGGAATTTQPIYLPYLNGPDGARLALPDDWESCVRGADIVVEASRLPAPQVMLKTEWIRKGALELPYGTMSAVELSLTDIMDKMVVDDNPGHQECRKRRQWRLLNRSPRCRNSRFRDPGTCRERTGHIHEHI